MSILDKVLSEKTIEKIGEIVERPINQIDKARKYEKILKDSDLRIFDMGTNRQVFTHKRYPNVVFLVALDEQGVLDNLNEYEKSDKSPRFPESYDIDTKGCILVQQRIKQNLTSKDLAEPKMQKMIRKMLRELDEEGFILIDLGLDKPKNFALDKKGELYIIDFGYVEYKSLANFNCPHKRYKENDKIKYCKGKLEYTKDFTMLKCTECGSKFDPNVVLEGYTEYRYADPPKKKNYFKPSDDLHDFYKQFSKTRDRSTLTKYVEISHKLNKNNKGDDRDMDQTFKDRFLSKIRGTDESEENKNGINVKPYQTIDEGIDVICKNSERANMPEIIRHIPQVSDLTDNHKAIVIQPGHKDSVHSIITTESFIDKFESEKDVIGFIEKLFNNHPSIRENVMGVSAVLTATEEDFALTPTVEIKSENEFVFSNTNHPGIQLIIPDGKEDELQIYITLEDVVKKPVICFQKDNIAYYIDIKEHVERLNETVDITGQPEDMIITSMYAEQYREFNGDYDAAYFENDKKDDENEEAFDDRNYGD